MSSYSMSQKVMIVATLVVLIGTALHFVGRWLESGEFGHWIFPFLNIIGWIMLGLMLIRPNLVWAYTVNLVIMIFAFLIFFTCPWCSGALLDTCSSSSAKLSAATLLIFTPLFGKAAGPQFMRKKGGLSSLVALLAILAYLAYATQPRASGTPWYEFKYAIDYIAILYIAAAIVNVAFFAIYIREQK